MSNIKAVSKEAFAGKFWNPVKDYRFTTIDAYCPVVIQEIPKASLCLPLAFIATGASYSPVALLGLEPGKNLLVTDKGKWLARYIPAAYRAYPFLIASNETKEKLLCFDEDSGLLVDDLGGESFFEKDGEPSQKLQSVLKFLSELAENRDATEVICAALHSNELIQPWEISARIDTTEKQVTGLFRIDEDKLNALDAAELVKLRDCGALILCYCQLLSMQHLSGLVRLANESHDLSKKSSLPKELDLDGYGQSDTLSFDNI